jgi:septum formation protein
LLERLGIDFEVDGSDIDESAPSDEGPAATARRLAKQKARDVADRHPNAWVLGADQTIDLDGDRLTKPGTEEAARRQLRALSGRTHTLTTAIALVCPSSACLEDAIAFEMEMRNLGDREICEYVDEDTPLDCAGSYKIEAAGIRLFRSMRGDDYTAIVGLPLTRVWNALEEGGYFETVHDDAEET